MASPMLTEGAVFAGDYRILAALAEGGMGAVYAAEQLSTGRRRALKLMHPHLVRDAKSRERFLQEARIGARIESEHVVEVVGAGVDEPTGAPWLAMEMLDGQDLAAFVASRGPVAPDTALEILEQACDAIAKAHASGVVHRDLKPENLFVAVSHRRGVPFTVKVLDFGIAKLLMESKTSATATSTIGSPLWMAPEQADRGGKLAASTDVWALGLIAFHMLTGRVYWRGANEAEIGITALLREVLLDEIEPASLRARQLGSPVSLPAGFDAWFVRCVARPPKDRFQNASELIAAAHAAFTGNVATAPAAVPTATPTPSSPSSGVAPTVAMEVARPEAIAPVGAAASHYASSTPAPSSPAAQVAVTQYAPPVSPSSSIRGISVPAVAPPRSSSSGLVPLLAVAALLVGAAVAGVVVLMMKSGPGDAEARLSALPPVRPVTLPASPPTPAPGLASTVAAATSSSPTLRAPVVPSPSPPAPPSAPTDGPAADDETDSPPAAAAAGATSFDWADESSRGFAGSWSAPGQRYRYVLTLRRTGSQVSGQFSWRKVVEPGMPPSGGTEWVRGSYEPASGRMTLSGYRIAGAVGRDQYRLHVTPEGRISGSSRTSAGTWAGRLSGRVRPTSN